MYKTYEEYLNSSDWSRIRARILRRDNYKCRICGSGINVQVHHLRYPDAWGEEQDEDLIVLCDRCHAEVHRDDLRRRKAEDKYWEEQRKKYREQEQNTTHWINQEKKRDFLYGGFENMCSLTTLKNSQKDYTAEHGCELLGVTKMQLPLGYAHWLMTNALVQRGYSAEDIYLRTPLDRNTVIRYLEKDRHSKVEENWNELIPLSEIKNVVENYIEGL